MKALAEDRIVLTLDLDFGDLALLTREPAARVILSFARTSSDSVDDGRRSRERPRNARRAWTGVGSRAVRSVDWDRERPDGRKLPGRDGWWGLTQAARRT
jgi:hypothetical protein